MPALSDGVEALNIASYTRLKSLSNMTYNYIILRKS